MVRQYVVLYIEIPKSSRQNIIDAYREHNVLLFLNFFSYRYQ